MSAIARLSLTESKLMSRDVGLLVSTIMVPLIVLLAWGSVPGIREADPNLGGLRPLDDIIAPIAVTLSFATPALFALPTYLAGWGGAAPQPEHLAVMAVTAAVAGVLSARLFRWE